jgi:hypoxanthine phosphoribosyltransferase
LTVQPDPKQVLARSELLHDAAAVAAAYDRMAAAISARLADAEPVVLGMMLGGLIPTAALATRLRFPLHLDYLHATRYRGGTRGSELHWVVRPAAALAGRSVLLVDDILDEGVTLAAVIEACQRQGAREVLSAVLVRKRHDRAVPGLRADFVGLEVPDRYVFGCGMDWHERFRNLPELRALAPEDEG